MQELSTDLIKAALLHFADTELDWAGYGSFLNFYNVKDRSWDVPGLGPVKVVDYNDYDSDKNYDGWSEQLWVVFEINGKFYKAEGTYTSYVGSEWKSDLTEVVPKTKSVTYYEEN